MLIYTQYAGSAFGSAELASDTGLSWSAAHLKVCAVDPALPHQKICPNCSRWWIQGLHLFDPGFIFRGIKEPVLGIRAMLPCSWISLARSERTAANLRKKGSVPIGTLLKLSVPGGPIGRPYPI